MFFCEAYAEGLRLEFGDRLKVLMAAQPPLEQTLMGQVLVATKGYEDEKQAYMAVKELTFMFNRMNPRDAAKHLQWLLRHAQYRGTDVRLSTSDLYDPIPIRVPYPNFVGTGKPCSRFNGRAIST